MVLLHLMLDSLFPSQGQVITRIHALIDRSFGDYGKALRTPDLRLGDVRTQLVRGVPPFEHHVADPTRGILVYVRRGDVTLEVDGSARGVMAAPRGSAAGFESGGGTWWRAASAAAAGLRDGEEIELFISSIPRHMGVLQGMADGMVIIPPDAEPFASLFGHAVETHVAEVRGQVGEGAGEGDDSIVRRCAEICLIIFVRYMRAKMLAQPDLPARLTHDEHLLRAWSAYYADPQRRWTVQALASAAGLGRTAFSERFRSVFGTPPLQTLTALRLEQAESMLRHSRAPLIEIAFTVGYHSEAAFVRAFHRQYGTPPGKFRAGAGVRPGKS